MAKKNHKKRRPMRIKEEKTNNSAFRVLLVKKGDGLKTIYAKVRASFTAADLQRYTQDEEMIPAQELIRDLEIAQRAGTQKRKNQKS
jgi:hypothetical protein